jgi:diaminopropionate ammonia-lyase
MSNANIIKVKHLGCNTIFAREDTLINPGLSNTLSAEASIDPGLIAFHRSFPESKTTPLIELPEVAQELGIGHVYVKDESLRFGLPSFKILGASWGVLRAICERTGLASSATLEEAGHAAREAGINLVACTDGNWGRAVARTAKYMGIGATIFVPRTMDETTRARLRSEGASVNIVDGSYDDSIAATVRESESSGAMLVMDTSWNGYVCDGTNTTLAFQPLGSSPTLPVALQSVVTSNRESKEMRGTNRSLWTIAETGWYSVMHQMFLRSCGVPFFTEKYANCTFTLQVY